VPMAPQPRRHRLVEHELRLEMPTVAERHHEHPGAFFQAVPASRIRPA
jgi:hypothetical protein